MKYKIEILMDNPFGFDEMFKEARERIKDHLMDGDYVNPWMITLNPQHKNRMLFQLVQDSETLEEPEFKKVGIE